MHQTGDSIANEVLLARDKYNGPVLLLEGDDDEKLFRRFVKDPEMLIIPAWGKENVLDAVEILEAQGNVQGFLGIVDADFGHVDNLLPTSQNIIVTDDHDVEMMIIRTEAFSAVLRELGSRNKVYNFTAGAKYETRDVLMQRALVIGYLRHLSVTDDLRLRFKGLHFEHFIKRDSLEIDMNKMVEVVLAKTSNPQLRIADIRGRLSKIIKEASADPYQICCGHDFVIIFGIALRKALGNKTKGATSQETLGAALRLAYDSDDFRQTALYASVKRWTEETQGYDIFT